MAVGVPDVGAFAVSDGQREWEGVQDWARVASWKRGRGLIVNLFGEGVVGDIARFCCKEGLAGCCMRGARVHCMSRVMQDRDVARF